MADEEEVGGTPAKFAPAQMFKQLSVGQMVSLGIIALAGITLIGSIIFYAAREEMAPLFRLPLDAKTQVQIKQGLDSRQVDYEVTDAGKILVPKSQVMELRTEFEAMDISPSGQSGISILDETNPLKSGEYMIKLKALQALAVDIEAMLRENPMVLKAKVQIVPAKDSPFADETQPAKASVMLRLRNQGKLTKAQVRGMQGLVASAIEGAEIDDVTITDHYYNLLSDPPSDDSTMGTSQTTLDVKSRLERDMERKIHLITETFLGAGKVKAQVSLDIDFNQVEQVEKQYGGPDAEGEPQRYSEQTKTENIKRAAADAGNVGVAANTAQGAIPVVDPNRAGSQIDRNTQTNQYFIDEKQTVTKRAPYDVSRISVALQLDYKETEVEKEKPGFFGKLLKTQPDWIDVEQRPLSEDEIERVKELVQGAIGFQVGRDFISVQNFPFKPIISKRAQASMETGLLLDYVARWTPTIIQIIIFGMFLMLLVSLFKRFVAPILQQAQLEEPELAAALPSGPPKTVAELESELEQEIDAAIPAAQLSKTEIMKKRLIEMVQQDPDAVSGLVRTWILEDE